MIPASELIINTDGSIYHLNIMPEDLANTVITVGDPDRVAEVSKYFDHIELKKGKREFITHTGTVRGKRISVISTGIGTDNIDIVLNELDALVNIDFQSRAPKSDLISLDIIRVGTSGAVQADLPMGTILASEIGIGFDALMQYYKRALSALETEIQQEIGQQFPDLHFQPYVAQASDKLLKQFASELPKGMTATAPGFYGPQGRALRTQNVYPDFINKINRFRVGDRRITNLEMETAGIYAMAAALGHHALSINAILASRVSATFSPEPQKIVEKAIQYVLERISYS
ncbi:nucleoside phosphorylase [Sphingobacterium spiritivorum]|uniref:nucleoside phosphorylase n=1 Tax=Sphingobacterium spiritivorum TaxID=258 RepID=UPI00191AA77C|nr:nucleoside phosphorylase [Sphingobacterium spiritivorum]QQS96641.1 nucleoside phosphorylase [Sphingobacterium spiritivorum]